MQMFVAFELRVVWEYNMPDEAAMYGMGHSQGEIAARLHCGQRI